LECSSSLCSGCAPDHKACPVTATARPRKQCAVISSLTGKPLPRRSSCHPLRCHVPQQVRAVATQGNQRAVKHKTMAMLRCLISLWQSAKSLLIPGSCVLPMASKLATNLQCHGMWHNKMKPQCLSPKHNHAGLPSTPAHTLEHCITCWCTCSCKRTCDIFHTPANQRGAGPALHRLMEVPIHCRVVQIRMRTLT